MFLCGSLNKGLYNIIYTADSKMNSGLKPAYILEMLWYRGNPAPFPHEFVELLLRSKFE